MNRFKDLKNLFKDLTAEEEINFCLWAHKNYEAFTPINGLWHPTIQRECVMINIRNGMTEIMEDDNGKTQKTG